MAIVDFRTENLGSTPRRDRRHPAPTGAGVQERSTTRLILDFEPPFRWAAWVSVRRGDGSGWRSGSAVNMTSEVALIADVLLGLFEPEDSLHANSNALI